MFGSMNQENDHRTLKINVRLADLSEFNVESALLEDNEGKTDLDGVPKTVSFNHGFAMVSRLLRGFGLFPVYFNCQHNILDNKPSICWLLIAVASVVGSGALFGFNVHLVKLMGTAVGIMHVDTISAILTGMKPLQTAINLIIFTAGLSYHNRFLKRFQEVDQGFRENFGLAPNWRSYTLQIWIISAFSGAIPLFFRIAHYILAEEQPGEIWIADFSIFFVPLLSVWQILPLCYFVIINKALQFWFRELNEALKKDMDLKQHTFSYYYGFYLQLTRVCSSMGAFFNPFIFFSLAISLSLLCLTIYFFIYADLAIAVPPNASSRETLVIYFSTFWAVLQIITAIVYVLCIAITGTNTNEKARCMTRTTSQLQPADEISRFQVLYFTNKVQTQFYWGVSVWKAFPIERSFLLTVLSGILTYTVVLLKLQGTYKPREASSEHLNLLLNGTFV